MLLGMNIPVALTLVIYLGSYPVTSLPFIINSLLPTARNLTDPLSLGPSPIPANDWEYFAYRIPSTNYALKGRIFTSKPIRPGALHAMIDGGITSTKYWISQLGEDQRLRASDNPYLSTVRGCHFRMQSKTVRAGMPVMTYGMMWDVFVALETVLEKKQRNFETSFVVVDDVEGVSWGHGEVMTMEGEKAVSKV
ncbi:MAG: hypothetical protein Q9196_006196 [Gyalolechia fulgens]